MSDQISAKVSEKIRNMSLICAFLVVSIHVDWPDGIPLSAGWFIYNVVKEGVARIAVPFFFIVSGFFLAQHFNEEKWHDREVRKRLKSLVVPFVTWSIITLVAITPLSIIADIIAHRPFGTSIYFIDQYNYLMVFGFDLADFPIHVPLWYVRCLFLFVLVAFVFKWLVEKLGYMWLCAAFLFNLFRADIISNAGLSEFFRMGFSASGIFYFSLGIFFARHKVSCLSNKGAMICGIAGCLLLTTNVVFVYNEWRYGGYLMSIALPFLIYFVWHFISDKKWPRWLTNCSFPIFLMHTIMFGYLAVILKRLPLTELQNACFMYFASIIGSIAITVILRRFSPRLASLLFGGR